MFFVRDADAVGKIEWNATQHVTSLCSLRIDLKRDRFGTPESAEGVERDIIFFFLLKIRIP